MGSVQGAGRPRGDPPQARQWGPPRTANNEEPGEHGEGGKLGRSAGRGRAGAHRHRGPAGISRPALSRPTGAGAPIPEGQVGASPSHGKNSGDTGERAGEAGAPVGAPVRSRWREGHTACRGDPPTPRWSFRTPLPDQEPSIPPMSSEAGDGPLPRTTVSAPVASESTGLLQAPGGGP